MIRFFKSGLASALALLLLPALYAADNELTDAEHREGWLLLFDGRTHAGWMNSDETAPRTPVEDGALNPHGAGHYMLVHQQQWENFVLALDFKITPHCNSGVFVRTSPLTPRPGKDVGFNGLEIAIDDTATAGFVDTGALYDLSKPTRNAMGPVGEWNHMEITCRDALIEVVLNGEKVNSIDLAQFTQPNRRPDGSTHKFDVAFKDHPRKGYIGLQDHGSPCWYKNIKLRPLKSAATADDRLPNPDTAGLPPRSVPEQLPERPIPDWLRTHLRVGHLPGSLPMAAEFLKAGYDVVTLNVLGKWEAVGPSAYLYSKERVKEAEDYMRTHVERCHAAGAKAVFYIGPVQVPSGNMTFAQAHPEWLRVRPNGRPDPTPNFANIRSGYGDWLLAQLAYVTREFKVDGYWFDGYAPVHLHSYDEATRQAFREFSGGKEIPRPLDDQPDQPFYFDPVHDPVVRQYLAWHEQHFVKFADRMRETIRRENPEAIIYANHSANRTWYFPNMYMGEYPVNYSSAVDVSSVELYWDVPGDPLYQQFVYAFMQGITHGRGAAVWIQPSAHGISGISSPVEIQLRGLECLPWDVHPEFIESTGREEYFKLHVENIKSREEWLRKSEPVPYLGIVASEQTRTLYAQGALPVYFSHTLGAFKAFSEKHLPVRVLTEYDLEDANLQGVRVLVLPNVACLSDRAAEVVRRFVSNGGGLIATFETSLYDANYQRRSDFALSDLFRAKYDGTQVVSQRVENLSLTLDTEHPIVSDPVILAKQNTAWLNPGNPPAKGSLVLVASAAKVTALEGGAILSTFRANEPASTRHPAIIASEYGKGRVVYFPASIDKGMFFYPDSYMRQMLANAARWVVRDVPPLVEVEGPLILTTTFRRQPEKQRVIVHLLNQASSWGQHSIYQKLAPLPEELNKQWGFPNQSELRGTWPVREEVIPLNGIRVICHEPGIKKATLQPGAIDLPITMLAGGVQVTVNDLGMHAMVVFE